MKFILIAISIVLASCSSIKKYSNLDKPENVIQVGRTGEQLVRIDKLEDLPNVLGNADVSGGKINKGFLILSFLGYNEKKKTLVFSVFNQDIKTNETTMSRYGKDQITYSGNEYSNYTAWGKNSNFKGSATLHEAQKATSEMLPANTFLVDINFPKTNSFNLGDSHHIEIQKISDEKDKIKYLIKPGQIDEVF